MGISESLFGLLLAYYSCDFMALQRPLNADEINGCTSVYEQVKTEVSGLDSTDPEYQIAAYLSFKEWESNNTDLVDAIRRQAEQGIIN